MHMSAREITNWKSTVVPTVKNSRFRATFAQLRPVIILSFYFWIEEDAVIVSENFLFFIFLCFGVGI